MKKLVTAALTFSMLFSAASFAAPVPASAQETYATNGHKIVNTAKSYQGRVTYKWGVRNPAQLIFDCSSFTQFVFQKNGKKIPWGSKAQAKWGTPVNSKSRLAIGDLVMFSVNKPGQIDHVGIYSGNGKFIGNSPGGGVTISSLKTGYWASRYITGRHY
ncbi:C40 family peptidase [Paenibacillus sp. P96]|uniref:C40 family peptidase n=1 Tax=Paenibacillus zeirhizosphaerae TaxID=2987519 RepID=A0ABT9FRB7_9BACL|nr:C40 family peptidase [Paenibacillus sp. P96]MDP4097278.1 C40 family peptidase [Paenibacillus sp. P96]